MIYKNFYIKYKMSQQIIKEQAEKIQEDIENPNSGPNVLEVDEVLPSVKENPEEVEEVEEVEEIQKIEELEEPDSNTNDTIETKESPKSEVLLKLGDIILISDPSNEILNDNVFLIEYIDKRFSL